MSILELVARLTPKTPSMTRGSKTIEGLTPSDIAAALSQLEVEAYHFACWHVNNDSHSRDQLLGYLLRETQQIAVKQRWSIQNNSLAIRRFCEAALSEWEIYRLCRTCKGSGFQIQNICDKCSGSGRKPMTKKQLAELCGVSHGNWKQTWEDKYAYILSLIYECQYKAERSLKKSLK